MTIYSHKKFPKKVIESKDVKSSMRKLTKSRSTLSTSAVSIPRFPTYSENYEKSRNLYLSTLVLMARDKIEQIEQAGNAENVKTDVFWSQLETMLTRHSAQMDRVAQQAVELRSSLSSSRKSKGTTHSDRMNKALKELKQIQKQINEQKSQVLMVENHVQEKETEETQTKIESANMEIEQFNFRIRNLRKTTAELKKQMETMRSDIDSRSSDIEQRKNNLDARAEYIASQLDDTINRMNVADTELRDLEEREKIVITLYESLKQPLPSIQRIFSRQ
ncbi:hypothetical protein TRFO_03262 [Tritrichomonas foetus]|uniref:Uncharacterized protein n=1 Tax=Tritrichomonas foetus TaxID=1144522 RepID=A0A1J4KUX1_9EUKA|nr:hypothetical protein TRFO_03262 [Tritrichomonas foetus]|eukprot:OHT13532.1 hypothetical protein TRFO_03262 [Tritrichomonas foetus]